jgi:hypothetical protein
MVRENGLVLIFIPKCQWTEPVNIAAVSECGEILKYVPYGERTEAVCLAAVKQSSGALAYVPEELRAVVQRGLQAAPTKVESTPMGEKGLR